MEGAVGVALGWGIAALMWVVAAATVVLVVGLVITLIRDM